MKRLYIFDFDDTLVSTGSLIRIKDNNDIEVRQLSSSEFADPDCPKKITEDEKAQGFYEDFSDFDKYPHDATKLMPIFDIFVYLSRMGRDVIVLTARGKGYPVKKFLLDSGVENPRVYAVKGSDPALKVEVVKFLINKKKPDGLSLFEDSVKNINAITRFMESVPDIDFRSVKVPHLKWLSESKVNRNI